MSGRRATTLTETLVAVFLLAVTGLFVLSVFTGIYHSVYQSRTRWWAATIAQNHIAIMGPRDSGASNQTIPGFSNGRVVTMAFHVQNSSTAASNHRYVCTVTVSWQDHERDYSLVEEMVKVQ